jgi:starvation-inducible DNA-binding protein
MQQQRPQRAQQTRRSQQARPEVAEALNHHLALAADLRGQVKQAHWSVVGPNFIALHHLFDDQVAILTAHIDLLAERLRALQQVPRGTLQEAVAASDLPTLEIRELFEEDATTAILERFEHYSDGLSEAIRQCEQVEDMSTQDLFIELQRQADLQSYFLRSHLPGADVALTSMRSRDGASEDARRVEE